MQLNRQQGGIIGVVVGLTVVAVRVIFIPDYYQGLYYFFILGTLALVLGFIWNERNK